MTGDRDKKESGEIGVNEGFLTELTQRSFVLNVDEGEEDNEERIAGEVRVLAEGSAKPVIVMLHGFKGFKDWGFMPFAAEAFATRGYGVVTFNFSHSGVRDNDFDELEKFGRNTYSLEQRDIGIVVSAVRAGLLPFGEWLDKEHIFLLGHSRGGGNAVLYAADGAGIMGIKAVAAWNGIAECNLFDEAFREQVLKDGVGYVANARTGQQMPIEAAFFHDLEKNAERFDIVRKAQALDCPALFLQGEEDRAFLLNGFERLREQASRHAYVSVEKTGHTWGTVHPFGGTTDALEFAIAQSDDFFRRACQA